MCGRDVTRAAWFVSIPPGIIIACVVAVVRYNRQSLSSMSSVMEFVDPLEQICLEQASEIGDEKYSGYERRRA